MKCVDNVLCVLVAFFSAFIFVLLSSTFIASAVVSSEQDVIGWHEYRALLSKIYTDSRDIKFLLERSCYDEHRINIYCADRIFKTIGAYITEPLENIERNAELFHVIVNRKPQYDTLIIGCGNLVQVTEDVLVMQIDDYQGDERKFIYRSAHSHENCDTLDIDWAKNPTIVAWFGSGDITPVFEGHRYKKIICEGVDITPHPYTVQQLYNILEEDGIVLFDFCDGKGPLGAITKQELEEMIYFGEYIALPSKNEREVNVIDWAAYAALLSRFSYEYNFRNRYCLRADGSSTSCSEEIFATIQPHINGLSYKQMKKNVERMRAIVNRKPENDTLIIGCGNMLDRLDGLIVKSIDDQTRDGEYYDYRSRHKHVHCDTISDDWAKNPSIVAEFGARDITYLFKGHQYKKIILEKMDPREGEYFFDLEKMYGEIVLYNLLKDDGELLFDAGNGPYGRLTKEDLKKIRDAHSGIMWPTGK